MGKLIAKTALITLACILALALLLFGVFSLFFPSVMVSITNGLGMDGACASYSVSVYKHTDDVNDLAIAVERSYYAERYGDAAEYGAILLQRDDFSAFCAACDQKNGGEQGTAASRVKVESSQYFVGIVAASQYKTGIAAAMDTAFSALGNNQFSEGNAVVFLASVAMTSDDKEYCSDILWRLSSLHPTGEDYDYFKTFSDSLAAYCAG